MRIITDWKAELLEMLQGTTVVVVPSWKDQLVANGIPVSILVLTDEVKKWIDRSLTAEEQQRLHKLWDFASDGGRVGVATGTGADFDFKAERKVGTRVLMGLYISPAWIYEVWREAPRVAGFNMRALSQLLLEVDVQSNTEAREIAAAALSVLEMNGQPALDAYVAEVRRHRWEQPIGDSK